MAGVLHNSSNPGIQAGAIPVFSLYGEAGAVTPDFVHIEDIRHRSEAYGWEIAGHRHHGLSQMLLLEEGTARLTIDARAQDLTGPFIVLIPSGAVHGFRFTPGTRGFVLTVEDSVFASTGPATWPVTPAQPLLADLGSSPHQFARLVAIFHQIAQECREGGQASTVVLQWLVGVALVLALRQHDALRQARDVGTGVATAFHRFRALVEQHYAEHWSVPRYAQVLHLSESRLNRICHVAAGRPALEILQERLMLEARRRLVHVAAPVSTIAYELGFEDPAYFWRFFRRRMGMTPRQFRLQQRERV